MALLTDLCLASTVAADLGVPIDPSVERCVSSASRAVARLCGREFQRTTVTEHPPSYGRPYLLLARPPLVDVVAITEGAPCSIPRATRSRGTSPTVGSSTG